MEGIERGGKNGGRKRKARDRSPETTLLPSVEGGLAEARRGKRLRVEPEHEQEAVQSHTMRANAPEPEDSGVTSAVPEGGPMRRGETSRIWNAARMFSDGSRNGVTCGYSTYLHREDATLASEQDSGSNMLLDGDEEMKDISISQLSETGQNPSAIQQSRSSSPSIRNGHCPSTIPTMMPVPRAPINLPALALAAQTPLMSQSEARTDQTKDIRLSRIPRPAHAGHCRPQSEHRFNSVQSRPDLNAEPSQPVVYSESAALHSRHVGFPNSQPNALLSPIPELEDSPLTPESQPNLNPHARTSALMPPGSPYPHYEAENRIEASNYSVYFTPDRAMSPFNLDETQSGWSRAASLSTSTNTNTPLSTPTSDIKMAGVLVQPGNGLKSHYQSPYVTNIPEISEEDLSGGDVECDIDELVSQ